MESKLFRPWLNETEETKCFKPKPLLPWSVVFNQLNKMKAPKAKKLICVYCQATFANLHHLRSHIRKHTGERPFICDYCKRSFTRKEELTRHVKIHTGEKRFKCGSCGKMFARKDHMKKHTVSMHGLKLTKNNVNYELPFENINCKIQDKCSKNARKKHVTKAHHID